VGENIDVERFGDHVVLNFQQRFAIEHGSIVDNDVDL
jgi:hypothetical protein